MPREFNRGQRIADLIQRELSHLLDKEMRDPRIGIVTVNEVRVSRDMAFADVYVTLLGPEAGDARDEAMAVLEGASGFLRSELARVLSTRTTPKLRFHYDETLDRGQRLTELIDKARRGDRG